MQNKASVVQVLRNPLGVAGAHPQFIHFTPSRKQIWVDGGWRRRRETRVPDIAILARGSRAGLAVGALAYTIADHDARYDTAM